MSIAAVMMVTVFGATLADSDWATSHRLATQAAATASSSETAISIGPLRLNILFYSLIESGRPNSFKSL
jgi:hypothetical protein